MTRFYEKTGTILFMGQLFWVLMTGACAGTNHGLILEPSLPEDTVNITTTAEAPASTTFPAEKQDPSQTPEQQFLPSVAVIVKPAPSFERIQNIERLWSETTTTGSVVTTLVADQKQ